MESIRIGDSFNKISSSFTLKINLAKPCVDSIVSLCKLVTKRLATKHNKLNQTTKI